MLAHIGLLCELSKIPLSLSQGISCSLLYQWARFLQDLWSTSLWIHKLYFLRGFTCALHLEYCPSIVSARSCIIFSSALTVGTSNLIYTKQNSMSFLPSCHKPGHSQCSILSNNSRDYSWLLSLFPRITHISYIYGYLFLSILPQNYFLNLSFASILYHLT